MSDADARRRALLEQVAERFGGKVPNVCRKLGHHVAALDGFVRLEDSLRQYGQLAAGERALVALEVAVANDCCYCREAFELQARERGVDTTSIAHVNARQLPLAPRDRALIEATRRITATSGRLGRAEQVLFGDRGIDHAALLEIIALIAAYTLVTYADNLSATRLDPEFR